MLVENVTDNCEEWKQVLSEEVSKRIGFHLSGINIYSDAEGYKFNIESKSLVQFKPLLMINTKGTLIAILPHYDFELLEKGEINLAQYVEKSFWSYGYICDNSRNGKVSFWQPLEETNGIHDTNKISEFLKKLSCRALILSHNHNPTEEECYNCVGKKSCPYTLVEKGVEYLGHDYRIELLGTIAEMVQRKFKLTVKDMLVYEGNNFLLIPTIEVNCCTVSIPATLNNDILYHPGNREWKSIIKERKFAISGLSRKSDRVIENENQENADLPSICRNFWEQFGILKEWERRELSIKLEEAKIELRNARWSVSNAEMKLEAEKKRLHEAEENYQKIKSELRPTNNGEEEKKYSFYERIKMFVLSKSNKK